MTQLLHIYTLAWCSKSIDFSLYQIDVHALQSHTLQRHDTVFTHIYRTTATSLHTCCNSYTSAIIQRAYKTILKIFNLMYSDLIENDYHSKIWREGTRIILKKSDKLNYSISKIYRIITLLNCLDKIAEKIIVVQTVLHSWN